MTEDLPKLLALIESSLADIAGSLEQARKSHSSAAIESAIADVVSALESRKAMDLGPLVAAIKAMQPVVNVTTPAAVVHVMPAAAPSKWKVTLPGSGYGMPDREMTIERVA